MTHCQHVSIADSHYKLSTHSASIADQLQHIFSGFHSPLQKKPSTTFTIEQTPDQSIHVYSNNSLFNTYPQSDTFVSQFEWHLIKLAFDHMPFVGIHCGGVIFKNKTILFPGRSGKGKSTLTLGCLLNGATFISDEMALISPNTSHVYAFPRVICIKNNAQQFHTLDAQNMLQNEQISRTLNNSLCVSPQPFPTLAPQQSRTIDAIIFPNYHPQKNTHLAPMNAVQSLKKLLKLTYNRTQTPQILNTLGQIVESAPSYKLTSNNLIDALKEVANLDI